MWVWGCKRVSDLLTYLLGPVCKTLGRHVQYSVTFAVAEDRFEPRPGRIRLKRIISNNSYAHDDQGDNPRQENRVLDGVLYKL